MPIRNTLKIAIKAIRRNKVRSGLTMLGVIIGVASVIAMIALGSGARASIDQQIQSQGTNVIYVSAGSFGRGAGAVRGGAGTHHHPDPRGRPRHRQRSPDGRAGVAHGARTGAGGGRQPELEHADGGRERGLHHDPQLEPAVG